MRTSAEYAFGLLDSTGLSTGARALPVEAPVELAINGQVVAIVMLTPADLEDFARGFCLSERLIPDALAIHGVSVTSSAHQSRVDLSASRVNASALRAQQRRTLRINSSCGLCGVTELDQIWPEIPPVTPSATPNFAALQRALGQLHDAQVLNAKTHAVHAAAWADLTGNVLCIREDLGRHNALDKLIGARAGVASEAGFCLLTSRCSYEMVLKAATAGYATIAAISAPSTLAVDLAKRAGMRLIALARTDSVSIFS